MTRPSSVTITTAFAILGLMPLAAIARAGDSVIVNGGAEAGTLSGWARVPANAPIAADTSVNETLGTVTPFAGAFMFSFAAAPQTGTIALTQTGPLDGALAALCLSGRYQTEFEDEAVVTVRCLAANGDVLGEASTGAMSDSDLAWTPFAVALAVPRGATTWQVELTGTLVTGTFINVFFDEIELGPASIADVNGDCIVNAADLAILLGGSGPCRAGDPCITDLNDDGVTDAADLAVLLGEWG